MEHTFVGVFHILMLLSPVLTVLPLQIEEAREHKNITGGQPASTFLRLTVRFRLIARRVAPRRPAAKRFAQVLPPIFTHFLWALYQTDT